MADETKNSIAPEDETSGATSTPADDIFEDLTRASKPLIQTAPLTEKPVVQATPTPTPTAQAEAQAPVRVFKFVKNMSPGVPVDVGLSELVQFHRARRQDGRISSSGEFRTRDAEVAEALRNKAKENPSLYIFETTQ